MSGMSLAFGECRAGLNACGAVVRDGVSAVYLVQDHVLELVEAYTVGGQETAGLVVSVADDS